uniref:Uncharacterized protein n=1 Tax=Candidatus Kentrum sp. LFY TaxID=2126342 RepID=A0A450UQ31_9GAMM|nr:MAG: hypothetical protein BECKLFY1418B_GA0070995_10619 [Candidatus Kentron sp. LFY]
MITTVAAAAIRATTVAATVVATTTTVTITTPTPGAATVAHSMLTPIPRSKTSIAIRSHPKGVSSLHRQGGSTSDQRSGESLRY